MYALLFAALASSPAQPPASHDEQNPLYKSLRDTGLTVGTEKFKLPAPTFPDGLNADKQKEAFKALLADSHPFDVFSRNTPAAPQILKIHELGGDTKATVRGVDVWFIVHGDFKRLEDDKFLDRLVSSGKGAGGGTGGPLTAKDLEKRKIVVKDEKREGYGQVEFDFLEKVRLKATGHAMWSRTGESVIATAEIDQRFADDKEFPNQWSAITRAGGQPKYGDPQPWSGAAMYVKITKLHEPAGAMVVEQHVIFVEPTGWFGGPAALRSKLPAATRENVITMRKEFQKK
jgi:hypothetical protein